ncbi:Serine/threonine-protein phosphatase 6 regulatory subunit [Arachis hypogaea]|nr:Serine/threonine-protein phosphatase 6 regulatory subunit [Arachis hypogaea]
MIGAVEQLICYIIEEAAEDAEKKQTFKFLFIACEIFTCEVDVILTNLVEDEKLMSKLISFLEPNHSHGNLLAGYFCKTIPIGE